MKKTVFVALAASLLAMPAARAQSPADVERALGPVPAAPPDAEQKLQASPDLATILAVARARNPDLHEARERVRAAAEGARAAGRLPDLEARYQLWGAPFAAPLDGMHMLGVQQTLPARGSLGARERAAAVDARIALQTVRARELDIEAGVRRAWFELYRADREERIRREFGEVARRVVELARAAYQSGRASQQDVLRAGVEVARIETELADLRQARQSAAALLNSYMARAPDAPLGALPDLGVAPALPPAAQLEEQLLSARPELASAAGAVERGEALLQAEQREAKWPAFMVGADYMLDPMAEHVNGFGLMVSANLPWLNDRNKDEVRRAERELAAERSAVESVRLAALYQLRDALARTEAGTQRLQLIERELLPQAQRSYEAAEAGIVAGQGDVLGLLDAERSLLQVRLDRERALALVWTGIADIERAVGAPLPAKKEEAK